MSDIKLSQLNSATSLSNTDIFAISQNIGGSNWESKSITARDVMRDFNGSGTIISVAKEGVRCCDTIKDAIAAALTLSPSESNPISIQVAPGTYEEDNPLIVPEWVTIYSTGDYFATFVYPQNDGIIFCVTAGNSVIKGLYVFGRSYFSNIGFCSTNSSNSSSLFRCYIRRCIVGIKADNSTINADSVFGLSCTGNPIQNFAYALNGGKITCALCGIYTSTQAPITGYYAEGSGSTIYMYSCEAEEATNGIYVDNGGSIDAFSCHLDDCTNTMRMGTLGSSYIQAVGCIIQNSVTNDLLIESASAKFEFSGHLNSNKFSIVDGADVNIVANDDGKDGGLITGSTFMHGKVSVGTPGALYLQKDIQFNIGEGSAFNLDEQGNEIVEYWSYDATAPSGSRFSRYTDNAGTQLTSTGSAIVIGCKFPFPAIRLDILVPMVLGGSYLEPEYWDGSSWIGLTAPGAPAGDPTGGIAGYRRSDFALRRNVVFENVETQFVEFSSKLYENLDWNADYNVLNQVPAWDSGESYFAVRFRNNGNLNTGMQFRDGKVKPHSFCVTTSGQKVNFGEYRLDDSLYIDSKLFYEDPVNPPSHVDLQISTNITYPSLPVMLKANASSQISVSFTVPDDIDTASPVTLYVDGAVTVNDPGTNILGEIYIARVDSNNLPTIGSIPEVNISTLTEVTTGANSFVSVVEDLDVSSYGAGDLLFIAYERLATDPDDTFSGDFILGDITFRYKKKFV